LPAGAAGRTIRPVAPRTAIGRIWDEHLVADDLIFCDLHLVQEVSSPQAFDEIGRAHV